MQMDLHISAIVMGIQKSLPLNINRGITNPQGDGCRNLSAGLLLLLGNFTTARQQALVPTFC